MRAFSYPVELDLEDGECHVSAPDIPEVVTFGPTRDAALAAATDAIAAMLGSYARDGKALPVPSPTKGRSLTSPSALVCAKAALYEAWRQSGDTKVALAARLGLHEREVRRLLDPDEPSKIDRVEIALSAYGQRLVVAVEAA